MICLLGPVIFTVVNLKKRPAITSSVLYDMDSCPFTRGIYFPPDHVDNMLFKSV